MEWDWEGKSADIIMRGAGNPSWTVRTFCSWLPCGTFENKVSWDRQAGGKTTVRLWQDISTTITFKPRWKSSPQSSSPNQSCLVNPRPTLMWASYLPLSPLEDPWGEYFKYHSLLCYHQFSLRGIFPSRRILPLPWQWIHFPGTNISTIWEIQGLLSYGKTCPASVPPAYRQTSRVSTMSIRSWAWHGSNYQTKF